MNEEREPAPTLEEVEHPIFKIPESVKQQIREADEEEERERTEARAAGAGAARRRLGAEVPRARTTDPATSHEAAASVDDLTAKQTGVLDMLRRIGPATDERLVETYLGASSVDGSPLPRQSMSGIRTRRHELTEARLVECVGRGATRSGRSAALWRVKEDA